MKPVNVWKKEKLIEFIKSVDKKVWAISMSSVVGVVLLWAVFIGPSWFDRPKLREQMQTMDSQIRRFHELEKKKLVWEENEKTYGQLIQEAKAAIYKEGEVGLLLGQVSRIAGDAGVDVVASKPKKLTVTFPAPYQDTLQAISYDFTVQGGYHAMGTFAAGIESNPKLFRIRSIQIVPVDDASGKLIAEFGLSAIAEQTPPVKPAKKKAGSAANAPKK